MGSQTMPENQPDEFGGQLGSSSPGGAGADRKCLNCLEVISLVDMANSHCMILGLTWFGCGCIASCLQSDVNMIV